MVGKCTTSIVRAFMSKYKVPRLVDSECCHRSSDRNQPQIRGENGARQDITLNYSNVNKGVRRYFLERHDVNLPPSAITSIPLEGHGKVEDRVEKLYSQIMRPETNYARAISEADTVMVAAHSQGCPVSVMLFARLIREGLIDLRRQQVCILLMAGISHGPFPHLRSSVVVKYVEAEAARQLFDFNDPNSLIAKRYHVAISQILNAGVRICCVGSWYDQVVPLYSATLHAFNHPSIYRAVHIEGSDYIPDFLSHLVVFALRLRNAGLSDRGLLVYLSEHLAGNVYGFGTQGHSTVYEEPETYTLAAKWAYASPVPFSYANIKKVYGNYIRETVQGPKYCNPYDPFDPYNSKSSDMLVPQKPGVSDPAPPFEPSKENPISDLLITADPTYHTKFSAPLSKLNGTWIPWVMAQITSDANVYGNADLRKHLDEVLRLFDEWEPSGKALKELQYRPPAMASNIPNSAQINEFASSFMSKLAPFGASAAKGLSQGLQYSKEVMGKAADVTELPATYKDLETQVDAVKALHDHFLKISVNYTRKAYDYQPPLTTTALNYASSMQKGITSLISGSSSDSSHAEDIPPSMSHALAKAASTSREGLPQGETLGVALKKFADTHNRVGDLRVKMADEINARFHQPFTTTLNQLIGHAMKARRTVNSVRLNYDAARAKLKSAKPEEEEKLRAEMEATEDEFVAVVDDAMAKMKLVIESPEPLKNLSDLVAAELAYFKAAHEAMAELSPEIDELQTTVHATVPTPSSTPVQVENYAYNGEFLSGTIWIENIAYTKVVQVFYSTAASVWSDSQVIAASYQAANSNGYETWTFNGSVSSISEFYVKYQVSGNTYYDNNNSNNYAVYSPSTATSSTTTTTTTTTSIVATTVTTTTTTTTRTTTTTTTSTTTKASTTSTLATATTVHASVPAASSTPVQVENYAYDGSTFSGTIWVENIAYTKVVQVFYSTAASVWSTSQVISAAYQAANSNGYETWTFSGAVASISEFYVEYQVSGSTYYDNNNSNNYAVSTPPATPTCSGTPMAAVTSGFQSDITAYFAAGVPLFTQYMMSNIHPSGTSAGIVVAAPQNATANNYFYHWIRDSSLVMDTVNDLYLRKNVSDSSIEQLFFNFQNITYKMQNEGANTGLGEAKFNVDGSDYTGGWCRPQDDGPALRATAFMNFATQYLAVGGSLSVVKAMWTGSSGVILPDLNYVISYYTETGGCDLWEEQRGNFFWTYGAQRRSLHLASTFATLIGDTTNAATMKSAAATLDASYSQFYNGSVVQEILSGRVFDSAVNLGAIHHDLGDGVFGSSDSRILASLYQFGVGMISEYTLNTANTTNSAGLPLGIAFGRYYGDVYNGASSSQGNPWYLCTAAAAEVAYRAAIAYTKAGCLSVDSHNIQLFNGAAPAGLGLSVSTGTYQANSTTFNAIVAGLETYGDKQIRRVQWHGASGYHLNEQYNRNTGLPQGVTDLTWSYSAMLTAYFAREELASL
ncbi:glycoside hydrolase 15 protein [Entophlyctis sp. JEL0112]|nr:glycoside hydrolase 15 protein [Entophlyctis sp. JEL0112]